MPWGVLVNELEDLEKLVDGLGWVVQVKTRLLIRKKAHHTLKPLLII